MFLFLTFFNRHSPDFNREEKAKVQLNYLQLPLSLLSTPNIQEQCVTGALLY